MPTPAPLTYHQSTFDLIQKQPEFSETAPLLIAQCEQAYGFAFPAALREWFSLTQAIAILATYSNQDESLDLPAIHQRSQQWQASFEQRAAPHPTLPFLIENQGVFICAVHFDGSDDPPVKVWDDDEHWKLWSDHFSSFICGWVWDHLYQMEEALQELPWKTYVLSLRFSPSQSHAPNVIRGYLGRKTGRTHLCCPDAVDGNLLSGKS